MLPLTEDVKRTEIRRSKKRLVERVGSLSVTLSEERKCLEWYLLKALNINYRDNFSTTDRADSKEVSNNRRYWRVGRYEMSESQLYSRFSQFVRDELGGSISDICYSDIVALRQLFCEWLKPRGEGYGEIIENHEHFKRDVEVLIAAHLNDALFRSFKSGIAGEYLSLMSETSRFALVIWGTLRGLRDFAHEAQGKASKYAHLTESSRRMMEALIEDAKEQMMIRAEEPLTRLMRLSREGKEVTDVKPTESLL